MDLSALESKVKALETSLDSLERLVTVATFVVVIGLVIEYWFPVSDLLKAIRNRPPFPWKNLTEMIGGVLVVLGVGGELLFQSLASDVQASIRLDSHQIEGMLNKEAGDANAEAGKSNERAKALESQVEGYDKQIADDQARIKASEAGIASANAASKQAVARAKTAEAQIASAREGVAKAEQQTAELNLKLEMIRQPRSLSPEQQERIALALQGFHGQNFAFLVFPNPESFALVTMIDAALRSAGWNRVAPPPSVVGDIVYDVANGRAGTTYESGIKAWMGTDDDVAEVPLLALSNALTSQGIPCKPHKSEKMKAQTPRTILISVGEKPL